MNTAIVDFGLGNLYSVERACAHAGMNAKVTSNPAHILDHDLVILPGVGAFGDAMAQLGERGLIEPLQQRAQDNGLLMGICLGMQLLMDHSAEFGSHQGLGIIPGQVLPLVPLNGTKVPQVGWNTIHVQRDADLAWMLPDQAYMYFVHSYYVAPKDPATVLATSRYGGMEFCCALAHGNVIGMQFHPERSGDLGLAIYATLKNLHNISGDTARKVS